jgi:photosystem II stability/assembly factor-like uncharacterized protein
VDLENELRRVLHARDVPTSVPDPVGPIHAGMLRRRRARRLQVASATLGVVAIALAASTLTPASLLPRSTPAHPAASGLPTPGAVQPGPEGPVPARFGALDLTFVSQDRGWALGTSPCSKGRCASVLSTDDGGRRWSLRAAPDAALPGADGAFTADCAVRTCVSHLRFSSTLVGYAFGPGLAMTLDGGQTWKDLPVDGEVAGLEAAGGTVVRLVARTACPSCTFDVQTAAAGTTSWATAVTTPQVDAEGAQLRRQGAEVAVLLKGHAAGGAGTALSTLLLSHDGGATWTQRTDPCGRPTATTELDTRQVAQAPRGVLVTLCEDRRTQAPSVRTSTDAGSTFGPAHPLPPGTTAELITSGPGVLLAASVSPLAEVLRSTDDGRTWESAVSQSPGVPTFLELTTGTSGTWVTDDRTQYWRTTDGGRTWTHHTYA